MRAAVDLHLHSCLSPCGDDAMTPWNIAGMAHVKGLDAIALTDHNACANLPAMRAACEEYGIALLPGMEATTREEVHVLCYFPSVESALAFGEATYPHLPKIENSAPIFGNQFIVDPDDEIAGTEPLLLISALDIGMDELVALADSHGGLCVPAHINRGSNSLIENLGFVPPGLAFAALEIDSRLPQPLLMPGDERFAVLHSSDAHYLENILERTFFWEIEEKSTRGVFDSLRSAQLRAS